MLISLHTNYYLNIWCHWCGILLTRRTLVFGVKKSQRVCNVSLNFRAVLIWRFVGRKSEININFCDILMATHWGQGTSTFEILSQWSLCAGHLHCWILCFLYFNSRICCWQLHANCCLWEDQLNGGHIESSSTGHVSVTWDGTCLPRVQLWARFHCTLSRLDTCRLRVGHVLATSPSRDCHVDRCLHDLNAYAFGEGLICTRNIQPLFMHACVFVTNKID